MQLHRDNDSVLRFWEESGDESPHSKGADLLTQDGTSPMRINNVLSSFTDAALKNQRTEPTGAAGQKAAATNEAAASPASMAALTQILAQYDVTRMSPSEFSEMLQKLHDGGAISDAEFKELSSVRVDLDAAGIDSDEKIDLRSFYREQLQELDKLLAGADNAQLTAEREPLARKLDWIEKFALVHAQPESLGLNAVA